MDIDRKTHEEEWCRIERFYVNLFERGHDLRPMLSVVSYFRSISKPHLLWPSTSMSSLGLSMAREYTGRLEVPMVYIGNISKPPIYVITFQSHQGETKQVRETMDPLGETMAGEIIEWLAATNAR